MENRIHAFPEIEPFHGLGQLHPDQLASLCENRRDVTEEQFFGYNLINSFLKSFPLSY